MKLFTFLLLFYFSGATRRCPAGWHQYQEQCFFISKEETNWETARSRCQQNNSVLLGKSISREQGLFLKKYATKVSVYWAGGHQDQKGVWHWDNSTELKTLYTPPQLCLKIMGHTQRFKMGERCYKNYYYICTKKITSLELAIDFTSKDLKSHTVFVSYVGSEENVTEIPNPATDNYSITQLVTKGTTNQMFTFGTMKTYSAGNRQPSYVWVTFLLLCIIMC